MRTAFLAATAAAATTALVVAVGSPAKPKPHPGHHGAKKARNVIFIQGDGMGIAHRELIRLATQGPERRAAR